MMLRILRARNNSRGELLFLPTLDPTFLIDLPAAADSEGFCRNIFSNRRTCSDVSISAHPHWRNQLGVGSDESAIFNCRRMLVHTVIVARDYASADIHILTDRCITQISEVHRFRSGPQCRFLDFDEVTDLCGVADCSSHSQMSIRTDGYVFADYAINHDASFQHDTSVVDLGI